MLPLHAGPASRSGSLSILGWASEGPIPSAPGASLWGFRRSWPACVSAVPLKKCSAQFTSAQTSFLPALSHLLLGARSAETPDLEFRPLGVWLDLVQTRASGGAAPPAPEMVFHNTQNRCSQQAEPVPALTHTSALHHGQFRSSCPRRAQRSPANGCVLQRGSASSEHRAGSNTAALNVCK